MNAAWLPALVLLWVALCAWLAHRIGESFEGSARRPELKAVIFLALLPLAVLDELIAKPQFDRLCADKAVVSVHAARLQGRRVFLTELPVENEPGLLVPVEVQRRVFVDARTRQPLVSFATLRAHGGKLARALGEAGPLTFDGYCSPRDWQAQVRALGLREAQAAAGRD